MKLYSVLFAPTPSNDEVKEWVELQLHSHNTPSRRGAQLKKHGDNFIFTFYLYLPQKKSLLYTLDKRRSRFDVVASESCTCWESNRYRPSTASDFMIRLALLTFISL
jgi:hypothetical protein